MRELVLLVTLAACGGRTMLGGVEEGAFDASLGDAPADHVVHDAHVTDAPPACDDFTGDGTPSAMQPLGVACDQGENTAYPPFSQCGGILWAIAWEVVPQRDVALSRIEIWTEGGGSVELLANDNGHPGAQLFQGSTGGAPADPPAWRGADVLSPIALRACHRYFLRQIPAGNTGICSWADPAQSVVVREYTNDDGQGWSGPFPGHETARLHGACL